ncbi:MAG TPA: hypothetical protein VFQ51_13265 [Vicinamibacteria bacterium]|nr:hypothetical protein [Vicinamibacteria bacterium]
MIQAWTIGVLLAAGPATPVGKPVPSAEFTDAAGDVMKVNDPGDDRDVVKLTLGSDGTSILVSATIAEDEHGSTASSVVELFIDTDQDAKTGGAARHGQDATPPRQGYEYRARLSVCMAWDEKIGSCAGGPPVPPKSRHVRLVLDQYTGSPGKAIDVTSSTEILTGMGPAGPPFSGRVLEGRIPYASIDAKPGQVVRISPWEAGSTMGSNTNFFPDVLLALK